jgi:hypothetical protein
MPKRNLKLLLILGILFTLSTTALIFFPREARADVGHDIIYWGGGICGSYPIPNCGIIVSLNSWTSPAHNSNYAVGGSISLNSSYQANIQNSHGTHGVVYKIYIKLIGDGNDLIVYEGGLIPAPSTNFTITVNRSVSIPLSWQNAPSTNVHADVLIDWYHDQGGWYADLKADAYWEHININPPKKNSCTSNASV